MRTLQLFVILSIPLTAFPQYDDPQHYLRITDLGEFLRSTPQQRREMSGESYGILGTPYVYPEFIRGSIYFSDKTYIQNASINYDCYNNRVLLNRGESDYIVNPHLIEFIEFRVSEDSIVIFKPIFLLETEETMFLKVLYAKESTLYMRYYKTFQKADYMGPYSQDRRYDEYIDEYEWYIQLGDQEIQRLKPRKRAILQIMETERKAIEKFIEEEKPDLKSDRDLIRLIELYDELQNAVSP